MARRLATLHGSRHLNGTAEQQQFFCESGLARVGVEMMANVRRRLISLTILRNPLSKNLWVHERMWHKIECSRGSRCPLGSRLS